MAERFSGITRELLDLNAQLDSMGGGDTRISPLSVIVRVRPPRGPNLAGETNCVLVDRDVVRLVDPRASQSAPLEKAQRTYQVSHALPTHSSQADTYMVTGQSALDFLWDGFNAAGTQFAVWIACLFYV